MAFFRRPVFALPLLIVFIAAAVAVCRAPAVRASSADVVTLASGSAVHLATPPFLQVGRRYAFTWPGGGPPQTFTVKSIRPDGWILVEVADETIRPELYVPGEFPTRWLHVGIAVSIQEMRALP
ncbi:MAG TPA: hypothetical protein VEL79_22395 [Vicinamibacterales bacterium]|nr:hypothetical protein [Vicinamibacterales bacterium]